MVLVVKLDIEKMAHMAEEKRRKAHLPKDCNIIT